MYEVTVSSVDAVGLLRIVAAPGVTHTGRLGGGGSYDKDRQEIDPTKDMLSSLCQCHVTRCSHFTGRLCTTVDTIPHLPTDLSVCFSTFM